MLFASAIAATATPSSAIVYEGNAGPGLGKHIVFLASDHEYRAEETCPALARILAKNLGFKCTVVFGVDQEDFIEAGSSKLSGLGALGNADLFFIYARFLNLPDEEMAHIESYLERGGPVVGLRTSSHAFKIPASSKYAKYDFKSKVAGYENGFGHQILGNTWVGHYGTNHKQGTRIVTIPEMRGHVILQGVGETAFCHAGGYVGKVGADFTVLTTSQPLVSMEPDSDPDPKRNRCPPHGLANTPRRMAASIASSTAPRVLRRTSSMKTTAASSSTAPSGPSAWKPPSSPTSTSPSSAPTSRAASLWAGT